MTLPLYRLDGEQKHERENLIKNIRGNAGLVFNKYFLRWKRNWSIDPGDKSSWLNQVITRRHAGSKEMLSEATERLIGLTHFAGGEYRCYKTLWRFATGLGLNNPIENGMAWHHTLGVPYLPGSSVKGMVRAWAEQWLEHPPQADIDRIFGPKENRVDHSEDHAIPSGAGTIVFFDALPVAPIHLDTDVMTPHYQDYYSGDKSPGDWMDPNPIPFLTVAANQTYLFAVSPRQNTVARSDLDLALQWLDQSLENIGAGAKTAAGYGRFARCTQTESSLKVAVQKQKEKMVEPVSSISTELSGDIAREMIKDQYDTEPELFLQTLKTKWVPRMQSEQTAPDDQLMIAELLKNWYQVYREKQWEKPNRKNAPSVKAIRSVIREDIS